MWSSFHLYSDIGLIIAFLGAFGVLINRDNIILAVLAIELMLYGIDFYLITLSLQLNDIMGQIFALFILTLAAAESALALAIITCYFRLYENILLREE